MLPIYCIESYNQLSLVNFIFKIIFCILIIGEAMTFAKFCLGTLFSFYLFIEFESHVRCPLHYLKGFLTRKQRVVIKIMSDKGAPTPLFLPLPQLGSGIPPHLPSQNSGKEMHLIPIRESTCRCEHSLRLTVCKVHSFL